MTPTNVAIEKFTVAQLAAAISSITGETVTAKSFNYKRKAVDRLKALIDEQDLTVQDILQAAGIEAVTPTGETLSGIGIAPNAKQPKPKRKPRDSKQAKVIEMLKRDGGATLGQIIEATGWLPHTVRGAISGALKKKLGYTIVSRKLDNGERVYRITGQSEAGR